MKKVSILLLLFSLFPTTSAFAYEAIVNCQEKVGGKVLKSFISPNIALSNILTDCLSRSDLRLEVVVGRPYGPDEIRPVVENEDGTSFAPTKELDRALCHRPEKTVLKYYRDFDEYVTVITSPRVDLDWFFLSDSEIERVSDLTTAQNECLKLSNLELVVTQD